MEELALILALGFILLLPLVIALALALSENLHEGSEERTAN